MKKIISLILSVMLLPQVSLFAEGEEAVRIAGRLIYSEDFEAGSDFAANEAFSPVVDGERSVMGYSLTSSDDMKALKGVDTKNVMAEYDFKLTKGKSATNNSFFLTLRANDVSGSGVRFGYHESLKYNDGVFSGTRSRDRISVAYSSDGDANVTKWNIGAMSDPIGILNTDERAFDDYITFRNSVHGTTAYTQVFAADKTEKARLSANLADFSPNMNGKLYFGAHNTDGYIDSLKLYELLDVGAISIEADNMELTKGETTSFNIRVSENGTDWISLDKSRNGDFSYSYDEALLAVDLENGTITALDDGELTVTITAKDFYEEKTLSDSFTFESMTDKEAAEAARDALMLDITTATADFDLPTTGLYNTTVTWSSNSMNIRPDGSKAVVTRTGSEAVVTLTAKVSRGDESAEKTFTVTVLAIAKPERDVILKGDLIFFENFDDEERISNEIKEYTDGDAVKAQDGALYVNSSGKVMSVGPFGAETADCVAEYDMKQINAYANTSAHTSFGHESYRFAYCDVSKYNPATKKLDAISTVRDRLLIGSSTGSHMMDKWTYYAGSERASGALITNGRKFEDFYTFRAAIAGNTAAFAVLNGEEVLDSVCVKDSAIKAKPGTQNISMQNTEFLIDNIKVYEAIGFEELEFVVESEVIMPGEAVKFSINLPDGTPLDKKYFDSVEITADSGLVIDKENCLLTAEDEGKFMVRIKATDYSDPDVVMENVAFVSASNSADKLSKIAEELDIADYIDHPESITVDFDLPTEKDGATIVWSSNSSEIAIENGKATVNRSGADKIVTLTADITIGVISTQKQFTVTVVKDYSDEEAIEKDREEVKIPERTTENITLPQKGRFGSIISWSSDKPTVISNDGTVKRGTSNSTVTLTAVFKAGDVEKTVYYNVVVPAKKSAGGSGGSGGGSSSGGFSGGGSSSSGISVVAPSVPKVEKFRFGDVSDDFWAADKIYALLDKGVIAKDTSFRPDDNIKREEFVKMAVEMFGLLDEASECNFIDCDGNMWYYKYVASAYKAGIVGGKDDGSFGVGELITREDMAAIIARILEKKGKVPEDAELVFADKEEVAEYAQNAVAWLNSKKIINGMGDNLFMPKNNATRAQCAVILYQAEKL